MSHFALLVDVTNKKLQDITTGPFVKERQSSFSPFSFTVRFPVQTSYGRLFEDYKSRTAAPDSTNAVTHTVEHHIMTSGKTTRASPRHLAREKLKIARLEFEHMLDIRIVALPPVVGRPRCTRFPKKTWD